MPSRKNKRLLFQFYTVIYYISRFSFQRIADYWSYSLFVKLKIIDVNDGRIVTTVHRINNATPHVNRHEQIEMNIPKTDALLSVVLPSEIPTSPSSQQLLNRDQQDEEASDCPLLTPSPPPEQMHKPLETAAIFNPLEDTPLEMTPTEALENINSEDGLNAYMNIVNSCSKPLNDEPSSRDPMVESTSSSESGSDTNEPVCTQLLTQLNTAYHHLAPDAQALENGGKPPLVGIQLVVPKTPKDYRFMSWNWPLIRKTCFWSFMSVLVGCAALVIGVIATMPKRCDPPAEWWQGSLFYEIFPASFQDSFHIGDGVGDIPGIIMRLDYLKNLGVQGIRLNSIFPATHYPEHFSNITSLMDIEPHLGTMSNFTSLVSEIHRRNMTIMLDIPLHPFVKDFGEETFHSSELNNADKAVRERSASILPDVTPTPEPSALLQVLTVLSTVPSALEMPKPEVLSLHNYVTPDHVVTAAIKFWMRKGVDGFYLKGLEHYVKEKNFVELLRHWKTILGPYRILICDMAVLQDAPNDLVKNVILNKIDLVDVTLRVNNGTQDIKYQIGNITSGVLFEKPGNPWVHWSIGSVNTKRIASTLSVGNASIAVALLGLMLPGTPSIFYGDEIGLMDCDCKDHQDLAHVHNLVPMLWDSRDGSGVKFSSHGTIPWLTGSTKSSETTLTGTISEMAKLRHVTPGLYVKAIYKDTNGTVNCDVRYTVDELIVVERWYPRRNSYVFVANLSNETRTKDLSFLYYGGHVVVGPTSKLNRNVYFKELTILPGEAFVIKLDK
ncbi:neutral and basic amino acid transport protein rBAT isoform X2 [Cephus cinctus]|uniref:Neutral and basic amino acid transport protein rBAT isoform X2 n=1 Tax=Cephus cinctus TaxID=211228 RepID=A0AAJ7CE69_CEPCN|nr:neutral and basic amino acid transport protein rBAT isoform X2 [Cephus cinctus]